MNIRRLLLFSIALALLPSATTVTAHVQQSPDANAQHNTQTQAPADGVERITVDDLKALLARKAPVTIIDVRSSITEKIKGALHIPLGEIEARLGEIPRDRAIITYCA